jgi:tetratricopeptide (TPR) repeat protein
LALMHRALAHAANQDDALALKDLDRAIDLNAKNPDIYVERARNSLNGGIYDRAIADASSAIRLKPNSSEAFVERGIAYAFTDKLDKALSDFNSAIEIDPKDHSAFSNRGNVHKLKGNYKLAVVSVAFEVVRY